MPPALIVLALILGLPILEIYLMIQVGGEIGAGPTILLTIATAVLGTAIARHQGLSTLTRIHAAMSRGEPPALELLEGAIVLVSALFLLLPGFFTDALGFLGLIPPLRRLLILKLVESHVVTYRQGPPASPGETRVIEGEVVERHPGDGRGGVE